MKKKTFDFTPLFDRLADDLWSGFGIYGDQNFSADKPVCTCKGGL